MKNKMFMRGLGVGIILTSLVLCVSYRSQNKDNNVIRQAKELGMVFPETETSVVEEKKEPQKEIMPKVITEEAVSASAVKAKSKKEKEAEKKVLDSKKDITSASIYKNGKADFVVRGGLLSSSVAREMEEAGIIDSADEFDDFIEKNGYGKKIRAGKYSIPKGANFETIAKIISHED